MKQESYDIIVIGGGMVGLIFAASVCEEFKVALVEAKNPKLTWDQPTARVSALNQASINALKKTEVYSYLNASACTSLQALKVWDALGGGKIDFEAADLGVRELGMIIENREVVRALWEKLAKKINIYIETPAAIIQHQDHSELQLKSQTLAAQLIVAADGARSWVRQQLNLPMRQKPYDQTAIVGVLKTEKPHQHNAYQSFLSTGPLGILPLADPQQMSMVWSADATYAKQLLAFKPLAFNCELTNALDGKLGQIELISELQAIPLTMRHVKDYSQDRVVLIGDAAHTVHPLAGQGANLGFMDAVVLAESLLIAKTKGYDIGGWRPLRRYQRQRKIDNETMLLAMRAFKEVFSSQSPWTVQLRSQGFNITDRISFLKHYFMRYALGINDV
ncbi:MAG: UbiH/UbiF/VisC/COQ6 family ubiquinone biosynthesis hydroxylase [Gammaproteobacteria bacterium]|nr:UbiH/UbiF/VisC/COQ6 family ubiquinone biosynthesis hydroxylase [Gammaproteobacteria bacterium]